MSIPIGDLASFSENQNARPITQIAVNASTSSSERYSDCTGASSSDSGCQATTTQGRCGYVDDSWLVYRRRVEDMPVATAPPGASAEQLLKIEVVRKKLLAKAKAEQALNVTLGAIMDAVAKGDTLSLIGFGTFS